MTIDPPPAPLHLEHIIAETVTADMRDALRLSAARVWNTGEIAFGGDVGFAIDSIAQSLMSTSQDVVRLLIQEWRNESDFVAMPACNEKTIGSDVSEAFLLDSPFQIQ
ncbi:MULTISPECIES: hypothetical protein [Rhizobium/Agrobacterium group]|jgi:hypothetical protein|uniref:Uncharacterized protein n=1 Tax=Agrobacterium genomosp. 2 str. CFBP 5494 TaxID=1183436 RepID=A0A9W5B7L6_9HYPH|nr:MULTISPECIES: hypothetical protein [Rhizobium/Agrobacterium group]RSC21495.1 hypothetical protein EGT36_30380 [Agrobacterium sp. FDAARGOS_525]CAD7039154.1 ribbon-helix-helix protein, CopG family [Rhizobium sp. P007]CDN95439.1 hypothetical protein BN949_04611 [Agrobacterium tumefaciens]CUX03297.1 hypothetical protein AGR2A_pb10096 [Agrobacterium genomosp. 2 str. CFBP 5494]